MSTGPFDIDVTLCLETVADVDTRLETFTHTGVTAVSTDKRRPDATHITFRLDPATAGQMERLATEAGQSPNLYAKDLVIAALTAGDEVRHELALLRVEVAKSRAAIEPLGRLPGDLASSINLLLVKAGKLTPEQADRWTRQTLIDPRTKE